LESLRRALQSAKTSGDPAVFTLFCVSSSACACVLGLILRCLYTFIACKSVISCNFCFATVAKRARRHNLQLPVAIPVCYSVTWHVNTMYGAYDCIISRERKDTT
jgi:hypothetical protein